MPSVVWRLTMTIDAVATGGNPCADPATTPLLEWVYVIAILPTVQVGLALLSFGLIRPWGEVFPRWMPLIGGRAVPTGLAATLATAGAVGEAAFYVYGSLGLPPREPLPPGCEQPGWDVLVYYSPMA